MNGHHTEFYKWLEFSDPKFATDEMCERKDDIQCVT
jgi:hypothetical protein